MIIRVKIKSGRGGGSLHQYDVQISYKRKIKKNLITKIEGIMEGNNKLFNMT